MKKLKGFTLVELLVVISIIGVLMALSIFGLKGARESSRDAKRRADLELIRSGLELFRSDCNAYPTSAYFSAGSTTLVGNNSSASCSSSNVYIASVPTDPVSSTRSYYYSSNGTTYQLCAALEQTQTSPATCTGSCTVSCNYKTVNP